MNPAPLKEVSLKIGKTDHIPIDASSFHVFLAPIPQAVRIPA
jgi:hypothetical protein